MTTHEIAARLVELCRKGEFETAQKELFADDALSIEPQASGGFPKETQGLPAIIEKGHQFQSMVEQVYNITVSEPVVGGNSFAISLRMDLTMKGQGRIDMQEICVYVVKEGKVASEQFFW